MVRLWTPPLYVVAPTRREAIIHAENIDVPVKVRIGAAESGDLLQGLKGVRILCYRWWMYPDPVLDELRRLKTTCHVRWL